MKLDALISDDFLLQTERGKDLFHGVAESLPIIDYHCHIAPKALMPNNTFLDIADLWVLNDPYKHRAMRINGIPEDEITGPADGKTKFRNWILTLDRCAGNPLHHWSYVELQRFFDYKSLIMPSDWETAWNELNAKVKDKNFNSSLLLSRVRAEKIVTSDLLCDTLSDHLAINATEGKQYSVSPSLRGDDILATDHASFSTFIEKLRSTTTMSIGSLKEFLEALEIRLDFFHAASCRIADHSLDALTFEKTDQVTAAPLFDQLQNGTELSPLEATQWKSFLLVYLAGHYVRRGWILAIHLGARRQTSSRLRSLAGGAGGFACIGNTVDVASLTTLLDTLELAESLPKTILFTLNPADNAVLATITGSYAQSSVPGKVQFGPAWWYNDHKLGITEHLRTISSHSLLERFIGMTTDSRSILSLTRHEYFRRIFCDFLGGLAESGEVPKSDAILERITRAVCYENALNWINGREMK